LYLEKCPNANWQEIKQAITSTAKTDGFTGITPNNLWGFGKIDALAALSNSLFNINISVSNDTLYATQGFSNYQWYLNGNAILGATNNYYVYTQQGMYSVQATNNTGCSSFSTMFPVGIKEIPNLFAVKIFPNPANKTVHILVSDKTDFMYEMYDLLGKLQLRNTDNTSTNVDISDFANGVYFIKVFSANRKINSVQKIIKK
jgi:hypothetical protein